MDYWFTAASTGIGYLLNIGFVLSVGRKSREIKKGG